MKTVAINSIISALRCDIETFSYVPVMENMSLCVRTCHCVSQ
jgi:hypothetical protein